MRRLASEVIQSLEVRIARLEKQAITKSDAYEALRDFMAQNRTNTRMIVEIGGYLQVLKDGGNLSDRDLKVIRKMMHRNNASDLADSFRSNPTGRQPSPRVVQQQAPRVVRQPRPRPNPKVEDQLPTAEEVYGFLIRSKTTEGGKMEGIRLDEDEWSWDLFIEPWNRHRLDHYVGDNYDCDEDDEDCDSEGWDEEGWWYEWAGPLTNELEKLLLRKYPVLKDLKQGYNKDFDFGVGEKGHISVQLNKKKFKRS